MGTLYIDRKGCHIKVDGNTLALYLDGKREGIVPLEPLKRVIFVGSMMIETSVIKKFSELGISAIFLSGRRLKFSGMVHGNLHNNGLLRLRQYEKALSSFSKNYAQEIVTRKIEKQLNLLKDALSLRPDLRLEMKTAIDTLTKIYDKLNSDIFNIESLKGLEGSSSSSYFSAYTKLFPDSLNFSRRIRRPPLDPVNAMLSLCYTLLHFEIVREIEVIGLDPTIGFYHQFEYGRESLACDIVELFRPETDRFVWNIFKERLFTIDDFFKDHVNGAYYLKKIKRKEFYSLYEEWAKNLRQNFTEEVRSLARRVNDETDTISE